MSEILSKVEQVKLEDEFEFEYDYDDDYDDDDEMETTNQEKVKVNGARVLFLSVLLLFEKTKLHGQI